MKLNGMESKRERKRARTERREGVKKGATTEKKNSSWKLKQIRSFRSATIGITKIYRNAAGFCLSITLRVCLSMCLWLWLCI